MFHNKMIKNIIDRYAENNIENYREFVKENLRLTDKINNLKRSKKD